MFSVLRKLQRYNFFTLPLPLTFLHFLFHFSLHFLRNFLPPLLHSIFTLYFLSSLFIIFLCFLSHFPLHFLSLLSLLCHSILSVFIHYLLSLLSHFTFSLHFLLCSTFSFSFYFFASVSCSVVSLYFFKLILFNSIQFLFILKATEHGSGLNISFHENLSPRDDIKSWISSIYSPPFHPPTLFKLYSVYAYQYGPNVSL